MEQNFRKFFYNVFSGDDIHNSKPHPEIYIKTRKKFGLDQESCLVIEDSKSGIEASLSDNIEVIGVEGIHNKKELYDFGVIKTIKNLNEILDLKINSNYVF